MKRVLKIFAAAFLSLSMATAACACDFGSGGDQSDKPPAVSYGTATVNYHYEYGVVMENYWQEKYSVRTGTEYELKEVYIPPVKAGYRFLGWTMNKGGTGDLIGTPFKIVGSGFGGTVYNLYAKYEEILFEVVYHLDGGVNHADNPTELTGSQTLKKPVKEKHNFLGWYRDPDFETYTTTASMTDDKTTTVNLYAKWQRVYEISYVSNQSKLTVEGDTSYRPRKNFTEDDEAFTVRLGPEYFENYLFLGWETEEGGELVQKAEIPIDPKEKKIDITFTAHYEKATSGNDVRIHIKYGGEYCIYIREGVTRLVVEDMYTSGYEKKMVDRVTVYYSGEIPPEVLRRGDVTVSFIHDPEAVEDEFNW